MDLGLNAIKPLLVRPDPNHLLELKLVNCITAPRIMENLLEFMIENEVHLRALSLVKMSLKHKALQLCSEYLKNSHHLEDLDLSWNNLIPNDFTVMLEILGENKTLRSLNLSCNMLIDKNDQNNKFDFKFNTALQEYIRNR